MIPEQEHQSPNPASEIRAGYSRMGLMALSAVVLSAATIIHVNRTTDCVLVSGVGGSLEIAAVTLMPYMISAAVAALTAIAIVTMMPMLRTSRSLSEVQERLREMAAGDLAATLRIDSNNGQIRQVARDLNHASQQIGQHISRMKVMNRQQWDLLEAIRQAAIAGECGSVLCHVDQMEKNWGKIAELESELIT